MDQFNNKLYFLTINLILMLCLTIKLTVKVIENYKMKKNNKIIIYLKKTKKINI